MSKTYVKVEEIDERKPSVYYGILISEDKEEYKIIGAKADKDNFISSFEFNKKHFRIEVSTKEKIQHWFNCALINRQKKLLDAEFELQHQKIIHEEELEYFEKVLDVIKK